MVSVKTARTLVLIYNCFMVLIYVCSMLLFLFIALNPAMMDDPDYALSGPLTFLIMLAVAVPFMVMHIVAVAFINRKSKWVYYLNMVTIAFGFTGLLTLFPAIFLLIAWIDKDVKEYYLGAPQHSN